MSTAVALSTYRHAVQHALDDVETYTVRSAAPTQIATNEIINTSPNASAARFDRRWVYVWSGTAAGQQRQIQEGSYVISTGALSVTPPWLVTPVLGDQFEMTGLLPSIAGTLGAAADYRTLIQRALGLVYVRSTDAVTLAGAGQTALPAGMATWLVRPDQVVRFQEASPVSGRVAVDASWRGVRLQLGAAPRIEIRAPFSGVLTIESWRPASSSVNGADSTTGPVADADTAQAELADVVMVTLLLAYQSLANRNASRPTGAWAQKYADQAAAIAAEHAKRMTRGDRSLEPAATEAAAQAQPAAPDTLTAVA